ncbi:phage portal protein [uncultured Roseobacter sp.]|uniref:phage portal protein n=1 Tax=uncultured Roseobacter sp. TaxID=114847 RepID=UPI00262E8C90|nr:phage portal protein [uncultured Roseobacter sp.]
MFGFLKRKGKTIDQVAAAIDGFGARSEAGQLVTERTALQNTTVLACVAVIADACAVPPLHVIRALEDGRNEHAKDLPIYRLLHRRPNEWQTSLEFRETLTMHAALTGDGFAFPVRDIRNGEISELLPLMPYMVTVEDRSRYDRIYTVADEWGVIARVPATEIFHLRNRSWDRVRGMSAVRNIAKAIGLSMAAEDNAAKVFENGGRASGILTTESGLSKEAVDRIKAGWAAVSNSTGKFKTAILDSGMKYESIAMSSVDNQTLEMRKMQVEEICRGFGVFPQMIGHSDKTATYASAEAFFAAHNRQTERKWQENWIQKVDEFILDGAGPLSVEFANRPIETAPLKDQGEFFSKALGTGGGVPFMTQNEVRAFLGMDPIAGGDVLREPIASTVKPTGDENAPEA